MQKIVYILSLAGCLLCVGCQRTKPQAPANKASEADTAQLSLVFLYQRLAEEADYALVQRVQASEQKYTLHSNGSWYCMGRRTNRPIVQKGQAVELHMQVYDLQGVLLLDVQETIEAGKRQTIKAVDQIVTEMHSGETATLLVPWYAGYGQTGTDEVPPYENLRIEIEIEIKDNY